MRNIKPIYKVFLGIVVILYFVGVYFGYKFSFHILPLTMDKREMEQKVVDKSEMENQFVWFTYNYDSGAIQLNCLPDLQDKLGDVLCMEMGGTSHYETFSELSLNSGMSGSFLVAATNEVWDVDGDGKLDSITISAKTDTNETQGWGYIPRTFGREEVPIEVTMSDKTQLMVLCNGIPYQGDLRIQSGHGMDTAITLKDGIIPFVDVRDLRSGIVVTCQDEEGKYLIGTYCCEYHKLLSKQHFIAMIPYGIFLGCVVTGIFGVCMVRRMIRKKQYSC